MILNATLPNGVIFITAESEAEPVTALCYRCLIKGCDTIVSKSTTAFFHIKITANVETTLKW